MLEVLNQVILMKVRKFDLLYKLWLLIALLWQLIASSVYISYEKQTFLPVKFNFFYKLFWAKSFDIFRKFSEEIILGEPVNLSFF